MIEVLERTSREVFLSRIKLSRSSGQGRYLTVLSIAVIRYIIKACIIASRFFWTPHAVFSFVSSLLSPFLFLHPSVGSSSRLFFPPLSSLLSLPFCSFALSNPKLTLLYDASFRDSHPFVILRVITMPWSFMHY